MSDVPSKAPRNRDVEAASLEHRGRGRKCPQEVKDAVLERIANGMSIGESMRQSTYEPGELYQWCKQDPDYAARFIAAKQALAHHYAQESVTLLDDGSADTPVDPKRASAHVNLLGQRSKARQWLASKWNNADYGEKLEHRGNVTSTVVLLPPLEPLPLPATARVLPESETAPQLGQGAVDDAEVIDG